MKKLKLDRIITECKKCRRCHFCEGHQDKGKKSFKKKANKLARGHYYGLKWYPYH